MEKIITYIDQKIAYIYVGGFFAFGLVLGLYWGMLLAPMVG